MLTIKIVNEQGKEFVLDGVAYKLYIQRRPEDEKPEVYMDWIRSMDAWYFKK